MELNPFNHVTYKKKERVVVDPGMYTAVLKAVTPKRVQDKKTGEKVWKLIFEFNLSDTGTELNEWFTISQHEKSNLVKLVKTMGGLTEEIRADKDAMWGLIKSKVGNFFTIMVTEDNGYNHITAATPQKSIKVTPKAVEVEDDIPFNV